MFITGRKFSQGVGMLIFASYPAVASQAGSDLFNSPRPAAKAKVGRVPDDEGKPGQPNGNF